MAVFPISATLLDAVVLSVVSHTAAEGTYGYRITQDVRGVMDLSESTLYPVLRRLQKDNLLSTYDLAYSGRNRRYYRLTDAGHVQLAQYLIEWRSFCKNLESVFFGGQERE